jgi:putative membrane protein
MLMDVIIDPIAFLGDQWFLGKIYFYREPGEYFHIPLTNFAGWFFVAAATLTCFAAFNSLLDHKIPIKTKQIAGQALLGPGLYFGILTFNLGVTFYIGEFLLGVWGTFVTAGVLSLVGFKIQK